MAGTGPAHGGTGRERAGTGREQGRKKEGPESALEANRVFCIIKLACSNTKHAKTPP